MIAIIDYGMGNLRSVEKGFHAAGVAEAQVTPDVDLVRQADGIVLPGVGAFRDAIAHLERTGMRQAVMEQASAGAPLLGICLGMQLLATTALEDGEWDGLGLVPGVCERLPSNVKVPHIGWNTVSYPNESALFAGIPEQSAFYFVHSYHLVPDDQSAIIGAADYGVEFAAAVADGNVFGAQFHPEKSSERGLSMLASFADLVRGAN